MNEDSSEGRLRLAEYVTAARHMHYGTVEQAIRAAGVNRATWVRVEAGENVRDDKLGAVESALGWDSGDAWRIMAGGEPFSARPAPVGDLRARIESTPMPESARGLVGHVGCPAGATGFVR